MAIDAIAGAQSSATTSVADQALFDSAIDKAKRADAPTEDELPEGFEDSMVEGAVMWGTQMILLPQANEILGEAMSDD